MGLGKLVYLSIAERAVIYSLMGLFASAAVLIGRKRRLTVIEVLVVLTSEAVLFLLTLPAVSGH